MTASPLGLSLMGVKTTLLAGALRHVENAEEAMQTIGYEEFPEIQDQITELLSMLDNALLKEKSE